MDLKATSETSEMISELNLEGFLAHQTKFSLLSAIEEAQAVALHDFQVNYVSHIESDWEETKRGLLESLGHAQSIMGGDALADDVASGMPQTPLRTPAKGPITPYFP